MAEFKTAFFLGANTPNGFHSLYSDYINNSGGFFYFIKAGPGCGKSSFMKKVSQIVENRNISAEYIYCSADKASLDGVYFPELKIGIVDATAPHILEPSVAGISGKYINLGEYYDTNKLKNSAAEITALNHKYKEEYSKAYGLMKLASNVSPHKILQNQKETLLPIEKRAAGLAAREFKCSKRQSGQTKYRYLNGFSADGRPFLAETVPSLAEKIYIADNTLGLSPHLMKTLLIHAESRGLSPIACLSPENPGEILHLLIPELSLAFISHSNDTPYPYEYSKHLRLDAMADKDFLKSEKQNIKEFRRAYNALSEKAIEHMKNAKKLHDEMEKLYNPYVDFDSIYSYAEKFAYCLL